MIIEEFDRNRHSLSDIKDLLSMAVGNPTPEKLRQLMNEFYTGENHTLFIAIDNGKIIGIIGLDITNKPHGVITHIAVHPDRRKQGIGSYLISHTAEQLKLTDIEVETDQDAVDFYSTCNFETVEIVSQYPGIRRFRCFKYMVE
jgi:ribosomal protein S18 acetylase RimI-like enzyme